MPYFRKVHEKHQQEPVKIFVSSPAEQTLGNSEVIQSLESSTQGDPVGMAMYALRMIKLQDIIRQESTSVKQVAYADGRTEVGKIIDLSH